MRPGDVPARHEREVDVRKPAVGSDGNRRRGAIAACRVGLRRVAGPGDGDGVGAGRQLGAERTCRPYPLSVDARFGQHIRGGRDARAPEQSAHRRSALLMMPEIWPVAGGGLRRGCAAGLAAARGERPASASADPTIGTRKPPPSHGDIITWMPAVLRVLRVLGRVLGVLRCRRCASVRRRAAARRGGARSRVPGGATADPSARRLAGRREPDDVAVEGRVGDPQRLLSRRVADAGRRRHGSRRRWRIS